MDDPHAAWHPASALGVAQALEPYGLLFLEEPTIPEDLEGYARIRAGTSTPIAGSERITNKFRFNEFLRAGAVDVLQPDFVYVGGITEMKKVAAIAELYQVVVAPHNTKGPVGIMAAACDGGHHEPPHPGDHRSVGGPLARRCASRTLRHRRRSAARPRPTKTSGSSSTTTPWGRTSSCPDAVAQHLEASPDRGSQQSVDDLNQWPYPRQTVRMMNNTVEHRRYKRRPPPLVAHGLRD